MKMTHLSKKGCLLIVCISLAHTSSVALDRDDVLRAMKKATTYMTTKVATHGGYLWRYSEDLKTREGEGKANEWQIWVQPPGTPSVGKVFVAAYKATGDKQFLDAAIGAAEALAWGQLQSGGWQYKIDFSKDGETRYAYRHKGKNASGSNVSTLDDNTTQDAIRCLMAVDEIANNASIHDAMVYALDRLLKAQYPNGAWPQRFPAAPPTTVKTFTVTKIDLDGKSTTLTAPAAYGHYYTFNDNAINDCISVMLQAHERYHDKKYLDSAKRAGDFIIASQVSPRQAGWAQQYDLKTRPEWARKFEPPAVCSAVTSRNIRTLVSLYLATGEEKYLKPIPAAIDWLNRSEISKDLWARFYELETNRPFYFTKDYKLVYTDGDLPTHYSFKSSYGVRGAIALYERVKEMGRSRYLEQQNRILTPQELQARVESLERSVQKVISALDDQGRWVEGGWISMRTFKKNMSLMATYLDTLRILKASKH